MESDPDEQRNLYGDPSHRSVIVDLAHQLQQWGEAYDDDLAARLGGWAATEK
jgi:hypothetical protein